jgi:hypothetical protein
MTYKSPKLIDTEKKFIVNVPMNFDYADPITKIKMNRKASSLFISAEELKAIHGYEITITVDTNNPTTEQELNFIGMQGLIKICTDNAEDIKNNFLNINLRIPLNEKEKHDNINILSLDFMKLKDRFMEFLKKDHFIKTVEEYSTNQKMKPFRKTLDRFVLDRDIYTHGQLHFLRPNFDYAIEFIDTKINRIQYAIVDIEILKSYNDFYKQINKLVETFNKTRQRGES